MPTAFQGRLVSIRKFLVLRQESIKAVIVMSQSELVEEVCHAAKNGIGSINCLIFPENDGPKKEQAC